MAKDLFSDDNLKSGSGRKEHQRMKHFLVYMYLLKYTDESNPATGDVIAEDLREWGINAERRSIYKDIKDLNIAYIMQENECAYEEAEEMLNANKELAIIKYTHPHGFFTARRPISKENAALLAECVYNARFIPENKVNPLLKDIFHFFSYKQAKAIKHDVFLVDRIRTNNNEIISNVKKIDKAIKEKANISFNYLKYTIQDLKKQVERKHGGKYFVSPYRILINDGNYYLLGLNEKQKITTYRIDRMNNVMLLKDAPRLETLEYRELERDIKGYTKRVFSMYGGERQSVEIRFINPLLDTVIDRFGTQAGTTYSKVDENHFSVRTSVEVSEQFFAWVCGFGKRAKIMYPESVVTKFKEFLNKIQTIY